VPVADGLILVATGVMFLAILEAEKQLRLVLARPSTATGR